MIKNITVEEQRVVIRSIGHYLLNVADDYDGEDVEEMLYSLKNYSFDELDAQDYFGTEGWEKFFGAKD